MVVWASNADNFKSNNNKEENKDEIDSNKDDKYEDMK